VPGRQPFWKVGVPASSRYFATTPKQVPWTVPLPEKLILCLGKYREPEKVRQEFCVIWPPPHPDKLLRVPAGVALPMLSSEVVSGALRSWKITMPDVVFAQLDAHGVPSALILLRGADKLSVLFPDTLNRA
jgi:hypothetical protein